jgi:SAM-dependent methyltransferase
MTAESWNMPIDIMGMLRLGADRPRIPSWEYESRPPGGLVLNLGAGAKLIQHSVALDLPEWDADCDPIPYGDETVTAIYALHFLEHVNNPIALLRECQRVLKPRCHLNVVVPHWNTQLAHSDLDHKSSWDEETWSRIFQNEYYDKDHKDWSFRIGTNVLMGIDARNLLIITQLIKER